MENNARQICRGVEATYGSVIRVLDENRLSNEKMSFDIPTSREQHDYSLTFGI